MKTHLDVWNDMYRLIDEAMRLSMLGYTCVPLCQPRPNGGCTAPWHQVPCHHPGKIPLLKGYRRLARGPVDLNWLRREFLAHMPSNVGMIVQAGTCVIDADSPEAESEVLALLGTDPVTPTRERRLGRGRGWIFETTADEVVASATKRGTSHAIDVLTEGSVFVVPLSVHASGEPVLWVPGRSPFDVRPAPLPRSVANLARPLVQRIVANRPERAAARMSTRVKMLLDTRRDLADLWSGVANYNGDKTASGIDFHLAMRLLVARVPREEVISALMARECSHRTTMEYCSQTVDAAVARIGGRHD